MRTVCVLLLIASVVHAAEPLDKLDPAKVPAKLRPPDSAPPGTLAMLGLRDGRWDTIAARADGKMIAVSEPAGTIVIWSLPDFKQVAKLNHPKVVALAFAPSGKTLAAADAKGTIRLWTIGTGATARATINAAHRDGPVWSLVFSPDGKTLATAGGDKLIRLWNVGTDQPSPRTSIKAHEKTIFGLVFSPDGELLASAGSADRVAKLWYVRPEKLVGKSVLECDGPVSSVSFAPDGKRLATASVDSKVRLWKVDGETTALETTINMPIKAVRRVQFAPDGNSIAALLKGETSDKIVITDSSGDKPHELAFNHPIDGMTFIDAHHLATTNEDSVYVIRIGKD